MLDLTPYWIIPPGPLPSITEGGSVSITLFIEERINTIGSESQFSVPVPNSRLRDVKRLTIGGIDTPFRINEIDETIYWMTALNSPRDIVITLTARTTFSLLNGMLPPGLSLDPATGVITGVVGNILSDDTFRFTIRAKNATKSRDRTFTLAATAVQSPATFFLPSLLPLSQDGSIAYKSLGKVAKGETFNYTVDIVDNDGVIPPLEIARPINISANANRYLRSPDTLILRGQTLQGTIDSDACVGQYFFAINIIDTIAPVSQIFMIEVVQEPTLSFATIATIGWENEEGSLGVVYETETCSLSTVAIASGTGATVSYGLAPISGPLPIGITIDPTSGLLMGTFPHVSSDTQYNFIVRARSGSIFSDRSFSITVRNRYNTADVFAAYAKLRIADKRSLIEPYQSIPNKLIFRSGDPSFGFVYNPELYIVGGLDASEDLDLAILGDALPAPQGFQAKDYHQPFRLILGTHKFAVARDSNGDVIYEVLYRELYDPMVAAGGFVSNTEIVTEDKVVYPQSPQYRIFPNSIRDMRLDLIDDIGFAVNDAVQRRHVGQDGPELLPPWMRSQQVKDDPSSVIGFHLGLVVAYLKPGASAEVARFIRANASSYLSNGRVYHFDKYAISGLRAEAGTRFDSDLLILDSGATNFDRAIVYSEAVEIFKQLN